MENAAPGYSSPLKTSLTAINMIVQRKMFSNSKDELALIVFGTEDTSNPLNEASGGYENVTLARELGQPDLQFLQMINNNITAGPVDGDFVDALVVAMDHLMEKTRGRKMEMRIVLFSDMNSEFGADQLDTIVQSMKQNGLQMTFVGPEVDIDDDENDDPSKGDRFENGAKGNDEKPLTDQQVQGLNCIRHMLEELDGEGMSLGEVLPMLSFFQSRSIKQVTTFRGPIQIGDSLKINVWGYTKVKEARPSSWKKLSALSEASANPGDMSISLQRSYHLTDDDQTEVEKENLAKAYRYGKTLVPYSKVDDSSLKLETERCLQVLGFTDQSNVPRGSSIGDSTYILVSQPDDEHAAIALSALCHALEEKNMVAIVRYCRVKNANPKLACLVPIIKSNYEGLLMIYLPFREDVRKYAFPSLDGTKKSEPSDEQLNAIDSLIDFMDLTKAFRDDDGEHVEVFKPKGTLNPLIQRQCQCIQYRALNVEEDLLPEIEDYIARLVKPIPEVCSKAEPAVDQIKKLFSLEVIEKKRPKAAENIFKAREETSEPPEKKLKEDEKNENDFSFAALSRENITEVGTADPIKDYITLIDKADANTFKDASNQMKDRILQLVNDSFLDQYYRKAVECVKTLREECIRLNQPNLFNEFLNQVRDSMMNKRRNDFWEVIKSESICPIDQSESSSSNLTKDESKVFFDSSKVESVSQPAQEEEEDVDDLALADAFSFSNQQNMLLETISPSESTEMFLISLKNISQQTCMLAMM